MGLIKFSMSVLLIALQAGFLGTGVCLFFQKEKKYIGMVWLAVAWAVPVAFGIYLLIYRQVFAAWLAEDRTRCWWALILVLWVFGNIILTRHNKKD